MKVLMGLHTDLMRNSAECGTVKAIECQVHRVDPYAKVTEVVCWFWVEDDDVFDFPYCFYVLFTDMVVSHEVAEDIACFSMSDIRNIDDIEAV